MDPSKIEDLRNHSLYGIMDWEVCYEKDLVVFLSCLRSCFPLGHSKQTYCLFKPAPAGYLYRKRDFTFFFPFGQKRLADRFDEDFSPS